MAKSMTGYGRSEEIVNGRNIIVELKSVNSRYFEFSCRLSRNNNFLEDPLKKAVLKQVSRGKVEVSLLVQNLVQGENIIIPNIAVAQGYKKALAEISQALEIENDITTSVLAKLPDMFTVQSAKTDEKELEKDVIWVAEQAIARFNQMRTAEGEKLKEDIEDRLAIVESLLQKVEQNTEGRVGRYTEKLYDRLKVVLEDRNIEENRLLAEAAIFADKTAVDEETVRLHSHIKQFKEIIEQPIPVGRKLDFLTQELNREINTIGSKCQEVEITRLVVDMKAEIEKIREQIQNIE